MYVQGLPWKIYISISTTYYQALNFYLKNSATEECKLSTWTCDAAAVLRIHSQLDGIKDYTRNYTRHTFNSLQNDWGYAAFIELSVRIKFQLVIYICRFCGVPYGVI